MSGDLSFLLLETISSTIVSPSVLTLFLLYVHTYIFRSAKSSRLLLKMQSMKGSAMTTNSDDGLAVTLELPMI